MRTIWQFGNEYICIEDGSSATEEEVVAFVVAFKAEQKGLKEREVEQQKKNDAEQLEWKSKYKKKIVDYFEMEEEDILHWDDEWLTYRLATAIFDKTPYPWSNPILDLIAFNDCRKNCGEFNSFLDEMKSVFPKHYDMAVKYFLEGNHDT